MDIIHDEVSFEDTSLPPWFRFDEEITVSFLILLACG
jgi:hypothetical protein